MTISQPFQAKFVILPGRFCVPASLQVEVTIRPSHTSLIFVKNKNNHHKLLYATWGTIEKPVREQGASWHILSEHHQSLTCLLTEKKYWIPFAQLRFGLPRLWLPVRKRSFAQRFGLYPDSINPRKGKEKESQKKEISSSRQRWEDDLQLRAKKKRRITKCSIKHLRIYTN